MTGSGSSCSSDDNLLDDSNDEACSTTINRPLGLTGLQNLGNTCYMNAAIQALSNCPQLTGFMTDCKEFIRKPGIAMTYQKLIQDMWSSKRPSYLTPHNVSMSIRKICPSFKAYTQQDAQEFLRCLLDQLHEDLKEPIFECITCSKETLLTNSNHLNCNTSSTTATNTTTTTSELPSNASSLMTLSHSSLSMQHQQQQQQQMQQQPTPQSPQQQQTTTTTTTTANIVPPGPGGHGQPGGTTNTNQHAHFHSIISEIFDGKILSCVQCLTCNNLSVTRETFQDLSLPIPTRDQLNVLRASRSKANSESESRSEDGASGRSSPISMSPLSSAGSSNSISSQQQQQQQQQQKQDTYAWIWSWVEWFFSLFWGPTVELEDCLSAFFSADELKGDNMYSCEKCGKLRNGIKYSKVILLPDILCIHLKRFRHEFMYSSKISSQVTFPLEGLDMAPYMAPYSVIDPEKQTQALHQRSASLSTMSPFSQHSSNLLISRSRVSSVSMSTTEATANDTVMTELSTTVDGDATSATIGESSLITDTLGESNEVNYGTSSSCHMSQSPMQLEQITTYDLVAVICHHGTPASGHYIAYCLNSTSDTWYEFDDQYVTAVDPHQVASCEAYVLFYRKTNDEVCQRRLRTVELIERCDSSAASTESSSKKSRSDADLDLLGRYFISNRWINRFNTFADPGPITNHDFLCEHHMVRPSQSNYVHHLCTMFSKEVWDYLVSKYGGGPACTSLEVCPKCEGLSLISKFFRNYMPPHPTSVVKNHSPSQSDATTNGTPTPSVTTGPVANKTAQNSTNCPSLIPSSPSKLTDTPNTPTALPMDTNE